MTLGDQLALPGPGAAAGPPGSGTGSVVVIGICAPNINR